MVNITVIKKGITDLDIDCIVNAANEYLREGSGVCGAIFAAADREQLRAECSSIGHCDTGSAVITSGCGTRAKYIIHAVGPVWHGGCSGEPEALYGAYRSSLELARDNDITSIAFPLISSGIFGYPKDQAWDVAIRACREFGSDNADRNMDIVFAVLDGTLLEMGNERLQQ